MQGPVEPESVIGVSAEALRHVMADFESGVTVVTTHWQGMPHAMTATAFCSVSLTPPLVLVSVGKRSRFHHAVTQSGAWAVSILSADQEHLARHFSHSGRDLATQFEGVETHPAPCSLSYVLAGAQAWVDCVTHAVHDAGDHTIVIGRVVGTGRDSANPVPLTYHRGTYS